MTSNDVPAPGAGTSGGRRRVLGRGPGTPRAEPAAPPGEPAPTPAKTEPEAAAPEPDPEAAAERPLREPGRDPVAPVPAAGLRPVGLEPVPEPGAVSPEVVSARSEGAVVPDVVREPEALIPGAGSEVQAEAVAPRALTESGGGPQEAGAGAEAGPGEAGGDGVFKVRLSNFEGPFDLLLQLISKHKLDVTEVALSKVTDEFMAHIRAMGPDWDLDQTTEFLVVAATLLDLKAARLLPSAEVEDEADLALLEARDLLFARLLQYRAYKQIADIFNQRLDAEARRYPRTVGLEPHHAELLPEVVISIGAEGFAKLAVKAMQPKPKPQVYVDHIHAPLVSVQEQASIVVARLKELGEASFRALVEDTDDTLTVVARFLALLELYREKAVALDQETALGELIVRWTGGEGEAQPRVTDEFDRPPEPPKEDKA
ncbi:segregation/condensation protein A [Streptomyces sp. NPDC051172]|uniref:segregation and condensation protein A n=1 Tax=Streptomyces sp. NPDC051172 TaxID=3155796 RepID=UPI003443EB10